MLSKSGSLGLGLGSLNFEDDDEVAQSPGFMYKIKAAIQGLREEADFERSRADQLQLQLQSAQGALSDAKETAETERGKRENYRDDMDRVKDENRSLASKLEFVQRQHEDSVEIKKALETEMERTRLERQQADEKNSELHNRLLALEVRVGDAESERDRINVECAGLRQQVSDLKERISDLQRELDASRSELTREQDGREHDVGTLQRALEDGASQRQRMEDSLRDVTREREELAAVLQEREGELAEVQKEAALVPGLQEKLSEAEEEARDLRLEVERLRPFPERLEKAESSLRDETVERKKLQDEILRLTREAAEGKGKVGQLEHALSFAEQQTREFQSLRLEHQKTSEQLGTVRKEAEELRTHVPKSQRAVVLEKERVGLLASLQETKERCKELEAYCHKWQKILKKKEVELDKLKGVDKENETLRQTVKTLEAVESTRQEQFDKLVDCRSREEVERFRSKFELKVSRLQHQLAEREASEEKLRELIDTELRSLQRWKAEMDAWDAASRRARKAEESLEWKGFLADQVKQVAGRIERRLGRLVDDEAFPDCGRGGPSGVPVRGMCETSVIHPCSSPPIVPRGGIGIRR